MLIDPAPSGHAGLNDEDKAAIQAQLERLLENPHFSHSRRFPSFLRFVVEQTLSGQTDNLKERTLGIEIFGRNPDYDTSSDPIVRVTAAEIRKRIAQYYQEPGHEGEIKVSLPSGSYVPHFHWPAAGNEGAAAPEAEAAAEAVKADAPATVLAEEPRPGRGLARALVAVGVAAALLVALAGVIYLRSAQRPAAGFFWSPVLNTSDPVLFCIADQNQYSAIALRDAGDPSHQVILKDNLTAVVIDDLDPIVKVAGILQANGKKYSLKGEGSTTLTDLRNGPTIFIGAFDNAWTLRLTHQLRYSFANDPEMSHFWIVDNTAPGQGRSGQVRWAVDRLQQMATNNYRDYAIVARFTDSNTGKLAVIVAGVGRGGTIAAGEFLTDPADMVQLERAAQAAGNKKNMEVVLSTEIIGGAPGTPKMEAAYFW